MIHKNTKWCRPEGEEKNLRWIKDKCHSISKYVILVSQLYLFHRQERLYYICFYVYSVSFLFSVSTMIFGNERKQTSNQIVRIDTHFPHYLIFCYKAVYILFQTLMKWHTRLSEYSPCKYHPYQAITFQSMQWLFLTNFLLYK